MAFFGKKQHSKMARKIKATGSVVASRSVVPRDARVLLRPRVTEKATLANDKHVYVFEVSQDATKREVAEAVKAIYNVVPKKVTTVRMRPQAYVARMRGRKGQKSGYKKAYVHLKKGETLDVMK